VRSLEGLTAYISGTLKQHTQKIARKKSLMNIKFVNRIEFQEILLTYLGDSGKYIQGSSNA
jgi:hypothetical protein